MCLTLFLAACSEDGESLDLNIFESTEVKVVKSGKIGACPSATLGEMASAFLSSPKWTDFTSSRNETVVELTGGFTYDGKPAKALIQFTYDSAGFEAVYLGINGVDQSRLVLSALFQKMCSAT